MVTVVRCEEIGSVDDLVIAEVAQRELRATQARVTVEAAGCNYVDALFVRGEYQLKPPLPFVPGSEFAGTVVEVGSETDSSLLGQRVLAMIGLGAFADEVVVEASQLSRVPSNLSSTAAAGLIQSYCTAWFGMIHRWQPRPGAKVLVLGASGGVGRAAIDVAKAHDCVVIAAASTDERRASCTDAGADVVIDSRVDDLKTTIREASGGGVDLVVDPVGGEATEQALRATTLMGTLLVIGFAGGGIPSIPTNQILLRNRQVIGIDWGAWTMVDPAAQASLLNEVLAAVASGRLTPPEPVTYSLSEASKALSDLLSNQVGGKAVLVN